MGKVGLKKNKSIKTNLLNPQSFALLILQFTICKIEA